LTVSTCKTKNSQFHEIKLSGGSGRERYYNLTPDGPLDLYCYVDARLTASIRQDICEKMLLKYKQNLSVDISMSIKKSSIADIDVKYFYFNENGEVMKDSIGMQSVSDILKAINLQEIPTLSKIEDEDFNVRLQFERFCIGYIQFLPAKVPEILTK